MSATEIAMATAAAPLYFNSSELPLGKDNRLQTFVDGGIWANCPVLVGVTEAVRYMEAGLDEIDVLSIGTTFGAFKMSRMRYLRGGFLDWLRLWESNLVDLIFSAQQASVVGTTNKLLKNKVARITREVEKEVALDDPRKVGDLISMAREDAGRMFDKLRLGKRFFDGPARPFKPVQSCRD